MEPVTLTVLPMFKVPPLIDPIVLMWSSVPPLTASVPPDTPKNEGNARPVIVMPLSPPTIITGIAVAPDIPNTGIPTTVPPAPDIPSGTPKLSVNTTPNVVPCVFGSILTVLLLLLIPMFGDPKRCTPPVTDAVPEILTLPVMPPNVTPAVPKILTLPVMPPNVTPAVPTIVTPTGTAPVVPDM